MVGVRLLSQFGGGESMDSGFCLFLADRRNRLRQSEVSLSFRHNCPRMRFRLNCVSRSVHAESSPIFPCPSKLPSLFGGVPGFFPDPPRGDEEAFPAPRWAAPLDQTRRSHRACLGETRRGSSNFSWQTHSRRSCDAVITAGAAQSNHCRQTAAGAAKLGLSCHLALGGAPPLAANGNLLLDDLLGATIHWSGAAQR